MYNRYIPQSDGTYRRNRIPDSPPRQAAPQKNQQEVLCTTPASQNAQPQFISPTLPPCHSLPEHPRLRKPRPVKRDNDTSIGNFLKQLLPQNFDIGDLLVVLLLLLMSGDCEDDQNTALLTLALYLFM